MLYGHKLADPALMRIRLNIVRPNTMMDLDAARAYWASMTHREKLFFVVANGNAASFAYERLEMHREAARTQVSRIEAAIQGSRTDRPEPGAEVSQAEIRDPRPAWR